VVVLPDLGPRSVQLVAVPTTVGTGAEVSQVAAVSQPRGKRLVVGERLRPDLAVLDPLATASLPTSLLLEGVLEAFIRAAGPYVGSHQDVPVPDALSEMIAERLVDLGSRLAVDNSAGPRAEVAQLSALSQTGLTAAGRDPFAARGWYIANELAWVTGVRKMTAVAAILPALWQAIVDGDQRLGTADRLRRLWRRVAANRPLSTDPVAGLTALLDSWRIDRRIYATPDQLAEAARRAVHCWGAGLPMLAGLRAADVLALLPAPQTP
jgi:NADP-dependent alcohol dehydrogenase